MKIAQTSHYVGDNWWTWSLWLDASPEELDQVASVEWILDPSFSEPVRRIDDRTTQFRLDSSGWGTFPIVAKVHFHSGLTDRQLSHHLQLEAPDAAGVAAVKKDEASTGGRRQALCVGINTYVGSHALSGAVRDASAWQKALHKLGFDVRTLLDQAATRAAILDSLRTMVKGAGAGDVVVFQFAGHGTQTQSSDDETLNEAFCPSDYQEGALITSADLAGAVAGLQSTVNLTFFLDCGYSGTITRILVGPPPGASSGTGARRPRFIRFSRELLEKYDSFRAAQADAAAPPRETLPTPIYFSACQPAQSAFEDANGGLFSQAALQILDENPLVSNAAFIDLVNARLRSSEAPHAALDCPPAALIQGLLRPFAAASRREPL
jgi:hypothetical protein